MATGIVWLDDLVKQANFPKTVDREGAALLFGQLTGFTPSPHTIRTWPISVPHRWTNRDLSGSRCDRTCAQAPRGAAPKWAGRQSTHHPLNAETLAWLAASPSGVTHSCFS